MLAARRVAKGRSEQLRIGVVIAVTVLLSLAAHFAMDELPHRSWTDLSFRLVPGLFGRDQMLRAAVLGLIVVLPCLWWTRPHWHVMIPAMIGGIYPDMEKVFYKDGLIREQFLIFPNYSAHWSEPIRSIPAWIQVGAEMILLAGLMMVVWKLSRLPAFAGPSQTEKT